MTRDQPITPQLTLPLPQRVRCATCRDLGELAVPIVLREGQRSFRLERCPDCDPDYQEDPR